MRDSFRNDIQGLRALAVSLVVLYHLGVPGLSGGFVGVDVFFAVSGFVIASSVARSMAEGRFSMLAFWRRRALRILPALIATILLAGAAGLMILLPGEAVFFGESALAALAAASNFYFHDRFDYFSDQAYAMPLLHTWSLGVEEQFYLLAPLATLLLRRAGRMVFVGALIALCAASFAYNLHAVFIRMDENHAFYMPMARFWEIGLGVLAALLAMRWRPGARLAGAMGWAGLALILTAGVGFDDRTAFPGAAALAPVVGATLLLLARLGPATPLGAVLSARPATLIGDMSYSIYLAHWPVLVLYRLEAGRALTAVDALAILAMTMALAWLSWRFVERPFRVRGGATAMRAPLPVIGVGWAAALAAMAAFVLLEGLPQRLTPEARAAAREAETLRPPRRHCVADAAAGPDVAAPLCGLGGTGPVDLLLWGDSHAGMIARPLADALAAEGYASALASRVNCPPLVGVYLQRHKDREQCRALSEAVLDLAAKRRPVVMLASRWANLASDMRAPGNGSRPRTLRDFEAGGAEIPLEAALARTVRRLRAVGAQVVVVGPVPESDVDVPDMLVRALDAGASPRAIPRAEFDRRQRRALGAIAALGAEHELRIVLPHESLCDATRCALTEAGRPLYYDDDHLNALGAARILPPILGATRDLLDGR